MHGPLRRVGLPFAVALLLLPADTRGQTVHYAYDAAGRLSIVADPRGDLAIYDYDAVGNLLSIRRIAVADAPDTVVIALVSPTAATRGAMVSIFGKGFGAAADTNAVAFNGAAAEVLVASPTRLTVRVPATATTGAIRVTTPFGTATAPSFRILDTLTITPPAAIVAPRGRVTFSASGDVRWSVDRVPGGDAQRGTISRDGVYVAPEALPQTGVRVIATSLLDAALEASARVTMTTSRPLFVVASPLGVGFRSPDTTFAAAAPVGLRVAPAILAVTPSSAARGETTPVGISGIGFAGATRVELRTASGIDPTIVVTNLTVSPDGSEATADIALAADAPLGPRVVRIVTPFGSSGDAVPGQNVFVVH
jgi:YD repeat-containing protein